MSLNKTLNLVQKRIASIPNKIIRNILSFQYLTGTRISEVTGKYAIMKDDYSLTRFNEVEVVLFSIRTAKRKGRVRIVALPLDKKLRNIINVFDETGKGQVFKRSDRNIQQYCKKHFSDINYQIEAYKINDESIGEHERTASTHALRHFRATDLTVNYGFDEVDRAIFFGWIIKGMGKRYMFDLWLQWTKYFPKLLNKYPILAT